MRLPNVQTLRETVNRWLAPPPINFTQVIAAASVEEQKRQTDQEKMRGLLVKALDTIERLEMHAADATMQAHSRGNVDLHLEILGELKEAAALADGAPWRKNGTSKSHAGQQLLAASESIKAVALREAKGAESQEVALRETLYGMAELELALEDRGWKRLIAQSQYEFSRFGIQSIILICRLYYIKNPLARRGVDCSAFYVFGRGFEVSSPDSDANEILQAYFSADRNANQLSHTALVKREKATYTDGNVFWAYFSDPETGELTERGIDAIEVSDIITDPNDADMPWFYRRDWTEQTFDPDSGRCRPEQRTQWYFALGYEGIPNFPTNQRKIEGFDVALDGQGQPIPVMHLKDGELPGWRFGCPRMYPAIDWLRAYRHVLEDVCTMWRALSRFAWNVETKGGAPAIAAFKQTLATTLANDLSQIETNPPPVTGSAFISGPNSKVSPMKTAGATMNPDSARRVLLMVATAFGLNENMLGDASTGSLATAQSLERTVELMFIERQEVWREVLQRKGQYALRRSLSAPKGKLREAMARRRGISASEVEPDKILIETAPRKGSKVVPITEAKTAATPEKITIEVKFPDILQGGIGERITAIVDAMTLKGLEPNGIDQKVGTGLILAELGVEDPTVVLEAMFPEDTYEPDRTLEPMPPTRVTATVASTDVPQPDADGPPDPNAPKPTPPPEPDEQDDAAPAPPTGKKGKKGKAEESISQDPEVIQRACAQLIAAARKNLREVQRMSA